VSPIYDMLAVILNIESIRILNEITLYSELKWIDSDFLGIMLSFCYCLGKTVTQIVTQLIKEFMAFFNETFISAFTTACYWSLFDPYEFI
jgi:hypothetical protein